MRVTGQLGFLEASATISVAVQELFLMDTGREGAEPKSPLEGPFWE